MERDTSAVYHPTQSNDILLFLLLLLLALLHLDVVTVVTGHFIEPTPPRTIVAVVSLAVELETSVLNVSFKCEMWE